MKIKPCGAAGGVTGSCHLVEVDGKTILVDCGLFQGSSLLEEKNREPFPFDIAAIQAVLLTHAHLDHAGLLPKLVRDGFRGPIYATEATIELAGAMLLDSARIQTEEAETVSRKNQRKGLDPVDPVYRSEDVAETLPLFRPVSYGREVEVHPALTAVWRDAGHILGSAHIQAAVRESGRGERTVVFSGDIGRPHAAILRDPDPPPRADILLMESTYGDRTHESAEDMRAGILAILQDAVRTGGMVLIPSFAVGRTQDILYALHELQNAGRLPIRSIYVDSPLGALATAAYEKHQELYDTEAKALARGDGGLFAFPGVHFTRNTAESKELNQLRGPAILIASSGMCEGGRILHHLKHRLWRPENHLVFVGYQVEGTLGRKIVDGQRVVPIHGEEVVVNAKVRHVTALSAHADRDGLLAWAGRLEAPPALTILVHGEPEPAGTLKKLLEERLGHRATVADRLEEFVL